MPKPSPWQLLRTYRTGRRIHEALQHGSLGGTVKVLDANLSVEQWYADGLGDYAMAVLDKRPAVVLSQTCDLQSKDFVQVAPIFPAETEGTYLARLQNWEMFFCVLGQVAPTTNTRGIVRRLGVGPGRPQDLRQRNCAWSTPPRERQSRALAAAVYNAVLRTPQLI
jgi:hypothetical protein